jgi:UDP-N-acetylglucosamine diphosphorylase/glucosamine-1-phosphate N-acetyltransferase
MNSESDIIIIMAGGLGKRMNSNIPKVLHKIHNIPMIVRIIEEAKKLNPMHIYIIVGKYRSIIENTIKEYINIDTNITFILQEEALGTGHAIQCCETTLYKKYIENNISNNVLILSGDVPLIKSDTMKQMLINLNKIKIMVTKLDNPTGYGRIANLNNSVSFDKIVEEKDCTPDQKMIQKVNCGIYAFDINILCKYIHCITNDNAQKEFYLTDIVEIIKNKENIDIDMYEILPDQQYEIMGVNTIEQLEQLEQIIIN